ncbi:MAG TPA: bacillithiol biosynthesis cysteine-adding enzyme BshC [Ohtaekwangia sp.]|nr:bacillithiol biosynthesis cysteine-adding enzyme BshC [Ohtaekwangia sp.]
MQLKKVSFADTHSFNVFFLDYIQQKDNLKPFYNHFPAPAAFKDQLLEKEKSFSSENRNILTDVLKKQYGTLTVQQPVESNLAALRSPGTFTVTTGHQLNIFTGPLYFIYKIITVINTCRQLRARYPGYRFVPVYWMASEDHDYEEIKSFRLYGKTYSWETSQKGAVGRFNTSGMKDLLNQVPGEINIFREAYTKQTKLCDAVRHYVNALFGHEGLLVIDADDPQLKSVFKDVIRQDLFEQVTKKRVNSTNASLQELGYKPQIHCRDINFFYLDNEIRGRIEKKEDRFKILDSNLSFSAEEIAAQIDSHPERFSPNVILRPLYQEMILPNLAYAGGPAEVIYWLQLKGVFDHFKVPFPILMPRNFAMIMDHEVTRKFEKTGLELKDLFEDKNYIFNHWVLKHSPRNLTVGTERAMITDIFVKLKERAESVDKTLSAFVGAEGKRAINSLEKIERKLLRAEKRLHQDKLRQIESVKDALFPSGNLQERTDNFLNFYQQDPGIIQLLTDHFDPFDFQFNVLSLDQPGK